MTHNTNSRGMCVRDIGDQSNRSYRQTIDNQWVDDEFDQFDDEQDDYLFGERPVDAEEREADLEADDLFDDQEETGFVIGQR